MKRCGVLFVWALVVLGLIAAVWVGGLGELLASRQIAFRDAGHFYYPLHQVLKTRGISVFTDSAVDSVWRESIVANPTSGVFYPITWILLLAFPTPFDEHLIVLVHLIIAALTARRLARSLGVSPLAATFAGFVYAASGSVLFQIHNIIFLIGAAWLPEAVRLILSLRWRHRLRDAVWLSVVVSLMIFGGDIQAVFHLTLFGLILLMWDFAILLESGDGRYRYSLCFFALLAAAAVIVVVVTSAQWVPTINAVLLSDRFGEDHAASANFFYVPLFRFVEFVYPNFSGIPSPQNTRWILAVESWNIWTPSLYAGIIPAVLVILSLRLWGSARQVALTWCLLVVCVAALGRDAGLYALIEMIPGYGLFRYPGKWITVASLPFSLLAATGLDTITSAKNNRSFIRITLAIAACVFFVMQIVLWSGAMEANITPREFIGPFQREMALQQFITGGVWGIGVLLIAAILARFILPLGFILVAMTVLDVTVMNAPLVLTASRESFDIARAEPLRRLIAENMPSDATRPPRLFRIIAGCPLKWSETTSPTRLDEWIARDIATLASRYHWLLPNTDQIDVIPTCGTFTPRDVVPLLHHIQDGILVPKDWQSVTQLGIDFFIISDNITLPEEWLPHLEQVCSDDQQYQLPPGVSLWRVRDTTRAGKAGNYQHCNSE